MSSHRNLSQRSLTDVALPVEERLLKLLRHLGLERAHFAARSWDWLGLVANQPQVIASLMLIGTDYGVPAHLFPLANRLLLISGDQGRLADAYRELAEALPSANTHVIDGYLVLPWSDLMVERPEQIQDAMFGFLDQQQQLPSLEGDPQRGEVAGIRYSITGSGPPLVLLPLNLAPSQWGPILPELSRRFRVIRLSGRHLGIAPVLETRGATPSYMDMLARLIDAAGLEPGERVLEVGVGTGAVSRWLARRSDGQNPITGVDVNTYLLEEAAAIIDEEGLTGTIDLRPGDALQLPFEDACFDLTLGITVLEEVEADKGLAELIRVTKPGGRIIVVVRAVDLNWVVELPLPTELKTRVEAAGGGVSPGGCADVTLYQRFDRQGLQQLSFFPYFVSFDRPELAVGFFARRNLLQKVPVQEHPSLQKAFDQAAASGTFMIAQPHHCAVGTKPRAT